MEYRSTAAMGWGRDQERLAIHWSIFECCFIILQPPNTLILHCSVIFSLSFAQFLTNGGSICIPGSSLLLLSSCQRSGLRAARVPLRVCRYPLRAGRRSSWHDKVRGSNKLRTTELQ